MTTTTPATSTAVRTTPQDLFSQLSGADAHLTYEQLRRETPVRPIDLPTGVTGWLVTRYDDARAALTDPRISKGTTDSPAGTRTGLPPDLWQAVSRHMLATDPPDHARLRRVVAAAFTARRVEALQPRVQEITAELLAGMTGRDRLDLINELAFPLPNRVFCELLGVPSADRTSFRAWSNIIVSGIAARDELPGAYMSILGYVRQLIEFKRVNPVDDLLSALVAVSDDGDRLTRDELSSTVLLLLIAGHETTVNLIGNGAYLLLTHLDQWDRLRAGPALLPNAIEEFLRYESPAHLATSRVTTAEVELGGQTIPAGAPVLISLLSANRDEARFAEPQRFDIGRKPTPHLALGHRVNHCLGAPLA
ncbi:MAG TPA: cytochrome P450, partial [Kribbellaceae bacterium]